MSYIKHISHFCLFSIFCLVAFQTASFAGYEGVQAQGGDAGNFIEVDNGPGDNLPWSDDFDPFAVPSLEPPSPLEPNAGEGETPEPASTGAPVSGGVTASDPGQTGVSDPSDGSVGSEVDLGNVIDLSTPEAESIPGVIAYHTLFNSTTTIDGGLPPDAPAPTSAAAVSDDVPTSTENTSGDNDSGGNDVDTVSDDLQGLVVIP